MSLLVPMLVGLMEGTVVVACESHWWQCLSADMTWSTGRQWSAGQNLSVPDPVLWQAAKKLAAAQRLDDMTPAVSW